MVAQIVHYKQYEQNVVFHKKNLLNDVKQSSDTSLSMTRSNMLIRIPT